MSWDDQAFDAQLLELAIRRHQAGQLEEAMANCRQILSHQPRHPAALHLVGIIARQIGRLDGSIELIRRAAAGNAADPYFHNDLADALRNKRQFDEAFVVCREALRIKPDFPEAYITLGNVLADQGQFDGAIAAAGEALRLRPDYALAFNNLGVYLHSKGQLEESIATARQAIRLDRGFPEFHNNLGRALQDQGKLEEAIAERREAIRLKPDYAEAHNDLGNALRDIGQPDESIAALRRSVQLMPDYALGHWNLALSLLLQGDFIQGWREYEWRWRWDGFSSPCRNFSQPLWNGEKLNGKTILLYAEQGMGDAIQFARYIPRVARRVGCVVVECQPPLKRLLSRIPSVQTVVTEGEPLPPFDVQCPLLSLPLAFRTDLNSIPASVPYLKPDRKQSAMWKKRLAAKYPHRRIGLAWAGSAMHKKDRTRSLELSQLVPLAAIPGTSFFSLQTGEAGKQVPPAEMTLHDFTAELNDFADTAALLNNLDLVITVDTAVAHLAGAMGKPVWVLVSYAPDWRWLLHREDSPWYPTMRLFRQTSIGDWANVIQRVANSLAEDRP
ncbi:MAG: tetratricopeptide repeat-containing glycosyltransferase family protein [Tepidisphaeraceae bacterium]|jgi:tetratricopeptide (TPR) repeat protein